MARAKRVTKKKKAGERISPTHALQILMTQMTAYAAAKRITAALHNYGCHIWRDGKLVRPAEVAHLSVFDCYDDANPDCWLAGVGDDRWDRVPGEYEFDADEISSLLPRAKVPAPPPAAASDERAEAEMHANPARIPPGPKPTGNWPMHLAAWLIEIALSEPMRLYNVDRLVEDAMSSDSKKIGWLPRDPKQVRRVIVGVLQHVR
jgi:hypothetical protein